MKKALCLAIAVLMMFSLWACGGNNAQTGDNNAQTGSTPTGSTPTVPKEEESEPVSKLQVGYAREKIMPEASVPLAGYGNISNRKSKTALDDLYVTCIAMTEEDSTVLLFTQDLISCEGALTNNLRKEISQKTGIPVDRILFTATHTHSAPQVTATSYAGIPEYVELYKKQAMVVAEAALADRVPAVLYSGSTQVEGMNFIRHYLMNDGTYYGSNFGSTASGYKDYAAENDPEMVLVKFDRQGDKKDVLLMNWQAHPCFTGGITKTDISADYIGSARTAVEEETGMLFAFFQGAAGNQNGTTNIKADAHGLDNKGYGEKLARSAIDALPGLKKAETAGIVTAKTSFVYAVNHDDEDKLPYAQKVLDVWFRTDNRDIGNQLAKQLGFSSVYHANAIISRVKRPQTYTMEFFATRIGDMAFINAPYEMFAASGMYIKENSPFETTMVITCSNNAMGYFPTMEAYDYGCYESHTCVFQRGIAEAAAEEFVRLLDSLQ